jgi:hypothetical protein
MCEIFLDDGIILPEEINLDGMDRFENSPDNSEDNTLLFDFDCEEANRERKKVNDTIKDLQLSGQWL